MSPLRFVALLSTVMGTLTMHAQQASPAPTAFETAVIHPSANEGYASFAAPGSSHYDLTRMPLRVYLQIAFVTDPTIRIEGDQKVLDSMFDVRATTPGNVPWTNDSIRPMVQQLLTERFHLAYHRGTTLVSGYALRLAKSGSKLTPLPIPDAVAFQKSGQPAIFLFSDRVQGRAIDAGGIAAMLSAVMHQPVVNHTDLTGHYTVDLHFAPNETIESDLPSIFTAVKEELGLELVPEKVSVKTIVVDHIDDAPTDN